MLLYVSGKILQKLEMEKRTFILGETLEVPAPLVQNVSDRSQNCQLESTPTQFMLLRL